jgi:hypothetical protein
MPELWDMILDILDEAGADEAAKIAIRAVKKFFGMIG